MENGYQKFIRDFKTKISKKIHGTNKAMGLCGLFPFIKQITPFENGALMDLNGLRGAWRS